MSEATIYIGGVIGAIWGALTLYVGVRSLLLGKEQEQFEGAGEK